jgi:hypothetical protein
MLIVAEFPIIRHWYLVPRRGKRLPAVAEVFKDFMLKEARALLRDQSQTPAPPEQKKKGGSRRS